MSVIDFLSGFLNEESTLMIEKDNKMLNEALYDAENKTIFINESNLKESAQELGIDLNVYGLIVYLHEFGHASDKELPEIDKKINEAKKNIREKGFNETWFKKYAFYSYKAEENAWKLAENYIKDLYQETFSTVRKQSLKLHKKTLEDERKLLKLNHKANV